MTNETVIKKFLNKELGRTPLRKILNGYFYYEGRTLQVEKEVSEDLGVELVELINYKTPIARIEGNTLYLNTNKYSVTTSKIQSLLRRLAQNTNYRIIEGM